MSWIYRDRNMKTNLALDITVLPLLVTEAAALVIDGDDLIGTFQNTSHRILHAQRLTTRSRRCEHRKYMYDGKETLNLSE